MTHPGVLRDPLEVAQVTGHVRSWLDRPCMVVLGPGKLFGDRFFGFLNELGTAGNLTTDAYLTALAVEHQGELLSADTEFHRFKGLRWRNPL